MRTILYFLVNSSTFDTLLERTKENGLVVNRSKTELVLFTRKYKVPVLRLSHQDGITLALLKEAKYLDFQIAQCAFYTYKKTYWKRKGLNLNIVHRMYTAVIWHIFIFDIYVIHKMSNIQELELDLRLVFLEMGSSFKGLNIDCQTKISAGPVEICFYLGRYGRLIPF